MASERVCACGHGESSHDTMRLASDGAKCMVSESLSDLATSGMRGTEEPCGCDDFEPSTPRQRRESERRNAS